MASVGFAVVLAIVFRSLQVGVFENLIRNVAGMHTGYLQIHRTGYQSEPLIDNTFYADSLNSMLRKSGYDLKEFVPRFECFSLVSYEATTKGCMVIGTDPEQENPLTGIRKRIVAGRTFKRTDKEVILSKGLATQLGGKVGDTIVLLGQGYQGNLAAGKYRICGIVHFASPALDKTMLYLPLTATQELYSANGRLSSLVYLLSNENQLKSETAALKKATGNEYECVTWKEMMPDIDNHIRADTTFFYIEISILYLVIAFGIFGTLIMMTNERKRENGMLLAIGLKKRKLGSIMFLETLVLGMTGTFAGMLTGIPIVAWLTYRPIRFSGEMARIFIEFGFEPIFPATLAPAVFLQQGLIVFLISILLGMYPYYAALRMNPLNSMKST